MRLNQRFFGQTHFEKGTSERLFCEGLRALKPSMSQYGFALRDVVPPLPREVGGVLQVKYNGMLSVVLWDKERGGFVAWSPRGRCYFSLGEGRRHPVTEYFNERHPSCEIAFVGETYVERRIDGRSYMTEFNRSMSVIKNPRSRDDVDRIKFAVFDYAEASDDSYSKPLRYVDRLRVLREDYGFTDGCDSGLVHLPDSLAVESSFAASQGEAQRFWDEFIRERGFEGLVMHTEDGEEYKLKYRDTLDAVIIAFRMRGGRRQVCERCDTRFDAFWLRSLARRGEVRRGDWFDEEGRLIGGDGASFVQERLPECPLCGGNITHTPWPIFGAKIALMTPGGCFVDVADGAQLSYISPILDLVDPLYEEGDYLWVRPEIVIEVSYQDLYVDRPRPVYRFEDGRYVEQGSLNAVSLRPFGPRLRTDKVVNPSDLRLEQLSYYVDRVKRIRQAWRAAS
jgi:hypothetical protein